MTARVEPGPCAAAKLRTSTGVAVTPHSGHKPYIPSMSWRPRGTAQAPAREWIVIRVGSFKMLSVRRTISARLVQPILRSLNAARMRWRACGSPRRVLFRGEPGIQQAQAVHDFICLQSSDGAGFCVNYFFTFCVTRAPLRL